MDAAVGYFFRSIIKIHTSWLSGPLTWSKCVHLDYLHTYACVYVHRGMNVTQFTYTVSRNAYCSVSPTAHHITQM